MPERIERQAARAFGGVVPKAVSIVAVGELMQRNAEQRRDDAKENGEQITEVKALPAGL